MRILRFISFALIVVTTCVVSATAQEAVLPEYVIQVNRPEGCLVAPITPTTQSGVVLYTLPRPGRVPPDKAGRPITSTVFVRANREGEQWHVRVTIGTGEFYDAGDFKVGEFKLSTNQLAEVPAVRQFGLTPIKVGVLKIVRQAVGRPGFRNLARSVFLETLEVTNLPDPFKLTLKNNLAQDLIAIQYNTYGSNGFLKLEWLSPGLLEPLVKSGEIYKFEVKSEDNACGDEEGYRPNQSTRIDLVSAVFADGTYEGEPGLAALIKGKAFGNRKNLEHVVETTRDMTDAAQLSQQFNYLQEGMTEDAEPYLVETLQAMLPALPADARDGLISFIRAGMHEVKVSLKSDAERLRQLSESNNPELTKRWVERLKAKYERWWTAAQNMTSH